MKDTIIETVRWAIEQETGNYVGTIDLVGVIVTGLSILLSGFNISMFSNSFIVRLPNPSIGHILSLGIVLGISLLITGYYSE